MCFLEKIIRLEADELKNYIHKCVRSMGYDTINADGYLYCEGSIPLLLQLLFSSCFL